MGTGGRWRGHNLENASPYDDNIELLAAGTVITASGTKVMNGFAPFTSACFVLHVTNKASAGTDTLNMYIQRELPNGDFEDIVSFTQMLGDGTDLDVDRADIYAGASAGAYDATIDDAALAPGTVRDLMWGNTLRIKWVVAGTGTFTLGLSAMMRV